MPTKKKLVILLDMTTLPKTVLVGVIEDKLRSQGKKLTNLKKASKSQLESFIQRFKITPREIIEYQKQKKQDAIVAKKQKEEREKREAEERAIRDKKRCEVITKRKQAQELFTEEEITTYEDMYSKKMMELDMKYYQENSEKIKQQKDLHELRKKIMQQRVGGVITEDGIFVNGVSVVLTNMDDYKPLSAWQIKNYFEGFMENIFDKCILDKGEIVKMILDNIDNLEYN